MASDVSPSRHSHDDWHDAPESRRSDNGLPASAAPSAAVISTRARRTEAYHRMHRMSKNERTLVVTIALFSLIVVSQFVGAYISNSRALLIDAASMLLDVATYVCNLWAECALARAVRVAEMQELSVTGMSLLVLWTVTLIGMADAIMMLHSVGLSELRTPDAESGGEGVDGRIVLVFALVGILFDAVALSEFVGSCREARRERLGGAESAEDRRATVAVDVHCGPASAEKPRCCARARSCCECCECASLELNMSSALAHVLADTLRSLTTLVESLLILRLDLNSEAVDGLAALCVACAIIVTALGTTHRWFGTCWRLTRTPAEQRAGDGIQL
jgi:Co/Zn/Cd efflux system component